MLDNFCEFFRIVGAGAVRLVQVDVVADAEVSAADSGLDFHALSMPHFAGFRKGANRPYQVRLTALRRPRTLSSGVRTLDDDNFSRTVLSGFGR